MEELLFRPFPSKEAHYTEFPTDATHEWPLTIPVHLNPLPQAHPCTGGTHHGLRLSSSATSCKSTGHWVSPTPVRIIYMSVQLTVPQKNYPRW